MLTIPNHLVAQGLSLILVLLSVGCDRQLDASKISGLPNRSSCALEAQLLLEAVEVFSAPDSSLKSLIRLDKGRYVYRCETHKNWLGIMFPAANEAVDCSYRQADRLCNIGWIPMPVKMDILG